MLGVKYLKPMLCRLLPLRCGIGVALGPSEVGVGHANRIYSESLAPFRITGNRSVIYEQARHSLIVCSKRNFTLSRDLCSIISYWGGTKANEWNKAVSEAEKIVGYSTSFLSLRCLLSDELSNVAMQMRKLVGTGHPLLKTARKLFYDDQQSMQTRGLLVLLVSKAAGPSPDNSESLDVMTSGIYQSQRNLAEITEMIHTANLIHKGLVNVRLESMQGDTLRDMEFGNKMAVLSGDFLLANVSTGLAALNNTKVVEIISSAIGDLMKAEFTRLRDDECNSVLPAEGATVADWETQTFLSSGSLIAKSCQSALLLAGHPKQLQDAAYEFGKQIGFAHRIHQELQPLLTSTGDENNFTVASLPAILYIKDQSHEKIAHDILTGEQIATKKLFKVLKSNPSVVMEAKRLCAEYGQNALNSLSSFPKSEATDALKNIVKAVTTLV